VVPSNIVPRCLDLTLPGTIITSNTTVMDIVPPKGHNLVRDWLKSAQSCYISSLCTCFAHLPHRPRKESIQRQEVAQIRKGKYASRKPHQRLHTTNRAGHIKETVPLTFKLLLMSQKDLGSTPRRFHRSMLSHTVPSGHK
jgi:hypothetical protein